MLIRNVFPVALELVKECTALVLLLALGLLFASVAVGLGVLVWLLVVLVAGMV